MHTADPAHPRRLFLLLALLPAWATLARAEPQRPEGIPATVQLVRGVDDPVIDFASTIIREAYARLGVTATDDMPPGERTLLGLNEGKYFGDIVHIDGFSRLYPNLVRVPVPVVTYYAMAMTDGRQLPIRRWSDLAPYRVCIKRGVKSIELMTATLPRRIVVAEYAPLFRMLRVGRCEVAVLPQSAWLGASRFDMKSMRTLEPPLQSWPLYHHVHKSNSAIVPHLKRVLEDMRASGYLGERQAQYQQQLEQAQRDASGGAGH